MLRPHSAWPAAGKYERRMSITVAWAKPGRLGFGPGFTRGRRSSPTDGQAAVGRDSSKCSPQVLATAVAPGHNFRGRRRGREFVVCSSIGGGRVLRSVAGCRLGTAPSRHCALRGRPVNSRPHSFLNSVSVRGGGIEIVQALVIYCACKTLHSIQSR